jgi:RNA polymerase sigma-70 factor (ECF subfamily)
MDALAPENEAELQNLAARLRSGEEHLLGEWYRREWSDVHRLCFGFLADPTEADDMAQDAMLHLKDRLKAWDLGGSYRRWRTTVVANLCRDRLRHLAAKQRAETRAMAERPESPLPHPESEVDRREVTEILRRALAGLPEREREVFVLRDLEGLPSAEVASVLEIGESTARTILSLARRRLRGILGPRLFPEAFSGTGGGGHA